MKETKKSGFLKNALAYSGTSTINQFITTVRGFVVRKILPPEIMGFWNFAVVVQGVASTFDLGCIAGAIRELPIVKGKGDRDEEIRIRSTALWFSLIQNIVISLLACLYLYVNKAGRVPLEILAGYTGILIFLITGFQVSFNTFYAGAQAFVSLSKILLADSLLSGITFPLCAYFWGVRGLMIVAVLSASFTCGLFFFFGHRVGLTVRWRIYSHTLKRLLSFGFFLRLVDYPNALFNLASMLWVTKFMGIKALAIFGLANSFFLQVVDISTRVATVYSMRFLEQSGAGTARPVISRQMKQFLFFQLLAVIPLLCWAGGVILPFVIRMFIPKYIEASRVTLILFMCGFFYVLNSGLTNPWMMEKKLVARGLANLSGLVMMVLSLSLTWFVFKKQTISAVACATVIGYYLYSVYMILAVGRQMWPLRECFEIILFLTISALWTFYVLDKGNSLSSQAEGFLPNLKAAVFTGCWTLLAILPVSFYGLKRSKILKGWIQ